MEANIYGDVLAVNCDDGTGHLIPLDGACQIVCVWDLFFVF